jgi:hypothetical protein
MKLLLVLLFLSSNVFAEPTWMEEPYQYCDIKDEICVGGKGNTEDKAESVAKNQILRHFKRNFRRRYVTLDTDTLNNIRDILFDGLKFKKYERDNTFYSLAILNKKKLKNKLEIKFNEIDKQIENEKNVEILKKLYSIRYEYNKFYYVINNDEMFPEKIEYNSILTQNKKNVFVIRATNEFEEIINNNIIDLLKDKINITNNSASTNLKTIVVETNLLSSEKYYSILVWIGNNKFETEFTLKTDSSQKDGKVFEEKIREFIKTRISL